MATDDTQYHCGCGFKSKSLEAAAKHCEERVHVVTVSGALKPEATRPTVKAVRSFRAEAITLDAEVVTSEVHISEDFSSLRNRLGKRK